MYRKRKRRPEQEPEPERPDTEMRQKLRQRSAEEDTWQDADANGISRSASADFELDPNCPAGTLLGVPYRRYTTAFASMLDSVHLNALRPPLGGELPDSDMCLWESFSLSLTDFAHQSAPFAARHMHCC